ncbi:TORTIFOLIA1-like protein 2 isoform X2 [Malania oleifera]|uniref:TORTIFOLIA1-like protein 2 isoform X2 n=1 Tax=Malania oleifera TaxID=397392 RepID=UPI0025AE41BD|nr:TORTIFOLIA1-like protein 2 isoform X2 [Malania oleifera]
MRTHPQMKAKGPTKVNAQQVIFELKQRVVLALNKLADRDTYQIGVEELEKTVECLAPEGIAPFLSCILDMDSEQKSAVRRECIRLMGILATFHEGLVGPHLGKMAASIVKRLKDPDSVVRDACVETAGVLALKLGNSGAGIDGAFVVLVRPLFEALGEQNKQVQFGSALCLAKVIDNTSEPPVSILQRMLTRTFKLLKNPHFKAKPAVIELNRSIIQAGGARTQNVLSAAISSIQEALKNSDWTTRKAASVALGEIASNGGTFLGSYQASCIHSLESCRFDKVKPVRDTVQRALQYWRSLPGCDTSEPSEAGSSIKENFCGGDSSDITSVTSDSQWKDIAYRKEKRVPLSLRNVRQNYVENHQQSRANDWRIEVAVPEIHNVSLADVHNEESVGSSVTKTLERTSVDISSTQDIGFEYLPMDDKQECSSVSNLVADNFEAKSVTVSHDCLEEGSTVKPTGTNQCFADEEISSEGKTSSAKTRDGRCLDSAVTESSCRAMHGCCLQTANDMASIRKQLLEIENKQSNLMELLKVFTTSTMGSLSMIQEKVLGLENVVEKLAQELFHGGADLEFASVRNFRKNQSAASPRLSSCTPRPSVEIRHRQSSLLSVKNSEIWEERAFGRRSRSNASTKQGIEMWMDPTIKISRNNLSAIQNSSGQGIQNTGCRQTRKTDAVFASSLPANSRKNSLWNRVKGFLCDGDINSAYVEALCSGDELTLIELLDRTGPVLESLSHKTVGEVLSTLASCLLERRFMNSIIPWLQQLVDLSTIHGPNYLVLSVKARREFLSATQQAVNMKFSNHAERSCVTQLATKLRQIWGKCS